MSSRYTFSNKMRLIGYYNKPNQKMHNESEYAEAAERLAALLKKSFDSLRANDKTAPAFKSILESNAVFILKDEENNLFAYYPCKDMARISDVIYNRRHIIKMPLEYKSWFIPGEEIQVTAPSERQSYRYHISTPGSDFLITDNRTRKTLPLCWDEDEYISIKELYRLINDDWVTLYEYDTEDDCGDCDGYDYSNCDDSRCNLYCERCGGREYICNNSCFNHRYNKALNYKLNIDAATKHLADLLDILKIVSTPGTEHSTLFAQHYNTLDEAYTRCRFLSKYFYTDENIIGEFISKMDICTMLNEGRNRFDEDNSITIYIDNCKVLCVNKNDVECCKDGHLWWKKHFLKSKTGTYNRVNDSIENFEYRIEFKSDDSKEFFINKIHNISSIFLITPNNEYPLTPVNGFYVVKLYCYLGTIRE